jgi:ribosomal protein S18 acetylase RimI-like enzyme
MKGGGAVSNDVTIRPCTTADEASVAALWRDIFSNNRPWHDPLTDVRRKAAQGDGLLLVGHANGVLIATVMIGYDGHRGWIYRLAVAPAQRKQGVGSAMVRAAEEELRARGCPKLNLQVEGSNRAVVGFYERLGYAVEDRVSMGKPL